MRDEQKLREKIAEAIVYDEVDLSVDMYDAQRYVKSNMMDRVIAAIELSEPQWNVFDKDDKSTWPQEEDSYWTFCDDIREIASWSSLDPWDWGVSFWMPIEVPQPPKDIT